MTNKKYLENQFRKNRDEWKFADADDWASADSEWLSTDRDMWTASDAWDSADAGSSQGRMSQPYIIQIVNACTSAISNVDIGDSYLRRFNDAPNFGMGSNISITSSINGITYLEWLSQTESQPFRVGKTAIVSATAAQFNQSVTITHRDANGKRLDEVITPFIDPYQNQTDRIISDYEYVFDGYTRLRFNQIAGSATVNVWLFPASKFVGTQSVAGRNPQINYSNPRLVKEIHYTAIK